MRRSMTSMLPGLRANLSSLFIWPFQQYLIIYLILIFIILFSLESQNISFSWFLSYFGRCSFSPHFWIFLFYLSFKAQSQILFPAISIHNFIQVGSFQDHPYTNVSQMSSFQTFHEAQTSISNHKLNISMKMAKRHLYLHISRTDSISPL